MARPRSETTKKKSRQRDADTKTDAEVDKSPLALETKHAISAIVSFALAIFFLLASFGYAGRVGEATYSLLSRLFGTGFFLLPLSCALLGISFTQAVRPNFLTYRLSAGLAFFLSLLGLAGVLFQDSGSVVSGGLIGRLIATPLYTMFDFYSLIILSALLVISLLVIFETKLSFSWLWRRPALAGEPELDSPTALELSTAPVEAPVDVPAIIKPETKPENRRPGEGADEESGFMQKLVSFGRRPGGEPFVPPPLSLLEKDSGKPSAGDIKASANIIKRTLANFGIIVEMDEISIGPSITRFALKPAEGVKLSRIVALQNDLSLALAAHPLRIEAPIPGKSLVGIEIPNRTKSLVGLASVLGAKEFTDNPSPLLLALGRGISGAGHFSNLAKAPHLLIAGATGSGKSVAIHTFIASLLYRNPPDRLRFIMIDPKRVELTLYNKIPHLLTPVVTDPKKAILVLKWAAKEMERRYNLLESHAVRDIQSYHSNIVGPAYEKATSAEAELPEKMPYIVVIIDELADIMSTYPRELEAAIVRLAQMSRAVGIHLMLSTQRPSVEVITGLIKANIPSRVALQVASQIDSRTILDMAGAEKLLGSGDMLYLSGDMAKPIRLQSAFISETEVKKVVSYLAEQTTAEPADQIALSPGTSTEALAPGSGGLEISLEDAPEDDDELYEEARQTVIEAGKASASYLQRKLKIGYARAARLLDLLEERNVIGPGEGAKQREVYEKSPAPDEFA
jgi:S-DNA-T family DNA segregation ATPase FtsK/SpoIIIE